VNRLTALLRAPLLLVVCAIGSLAAAGPVAAHGVAPDATSLWAVLTAWSFEAHVLLPLVVAGLVYRWGVGAVNRAHPRNRVPRWRPWAWYGGLVVLFVALGSPIATYDTTLFSAHMVQHLLMTMAAAPLLALGAPITLLLRVSSPVTRRRIILPVLHSRPVRLVAHPVVTWVLFAGVMWASHFSPLFDAALESEVIHVFEHVLFLSVALLFWWPAVGADPSPWRLPHPARIGYVFLGMPQSSFLGLAIFSAPGVLYPHYETLARAWGPTPLQDQQLAGGIMWAVGDGFFLLAMILAVWVWLRAEEAEGRRADARLDREAELAARGVAPAPAGTPSVPNDR
jgi:putative copper resistance protein D